MLLARDECRLLVEVGLLAASRADVPRAERIFGALARMRPDGPFVYVGLGMAYLHARRVMDALAILDRGLGAVKPADRHELHALRGMALQMAGRVAESRKALAEAGDLPLARALLGERDVAKEGV